MTEVLSQTEIEALLAEIATPVPLDAADDAPGVGGSEPGGIRQSQRKVFLPLSRRRNPRINGRTGSIAYEPYDFRRPDKLSKDQLRTLQILHESFVRLFASTISGYLRTQVQVELTSIEQIAYEEYTRSISASLINILDVKPLSGQALFEVDLRILFVMIDRLLGGRGEGGLKSTRDLTEIEQVLAENIVGRALKDLEAAWENVQRLTFETVSIDTTAQFLQIVPNNDTVLLVLFDVRVGERQGAMSVCMPYQLMKPILNKLNAQRWFQSGSKKSATNLAPQVAERLRQTTRVNCIARLGTVRMTMGEVGELTPGQIIPLTLPAGTGEAPSPEAGLNRAEILVGNAPKFRGRIGLREGRRLAIQIEEVLPTPQPLISHKEAS